ncbi:uncharacterized protein LOC128987734 [Macrosteles quadrilineatus]|uniref:uncharacterized protein LOC128987734 n=1 Tax=Macrosteles quadrilineatus TaxID=74068 RepID=UPI0023E3355E|nr:uncharacterized protein LOC128987734 [Macrosteles quadrilineatus]
MILRVLLAVFIFVVARAAYDDAEAEDTRPITLSVFTDKYKEYVAKVKDCKLRMNDNLVQQCLDEVNSKFRTITHRGVNCEVIEELSCKRGHFGKYEIIIDDHEQKVELPC